MPGMAPLETLYQYNAELNLGNEFKQQPNTVYWLKIVALADNQNTQWGWHDRDWSILDPLASTPPAVVPGEFTSPAPIVDPVKGFTGFVHHFQDDAVQGTVQLSVSPTMPTMPFIEAQSIGTPQRYIFPWDGPDIIQQYSKDLAFELYTRVPEPASVILFAVSLLAMIGVRRRTN